MKSRSTHSLLADSGLTAGKPRPTAEISGHEHEVLAVAISPDGRHLASAGNDGTARLWDITDRHRTNLVSFVERDMGYVYAVAYSPDGSILATANWDTTAKLFDVTDPVAPRERSVLRGHLLPVSGVAFSTDGKTVATTSQDATARLWSISDPDKPRLLAAPLVGDNEAVHSVAFSPDRHTLATVGRGRDVRLWEIDVDRAVTEICATVVSPISADQWHRYFPGQAYEPPCPARADNEFRNAVREAPAGSTPLVARNSEKCVVIKDDGAPTGAPAHQVGCTGALGENWTLRDETTAEPRNTGDRIIRIVNAASDMCLESADAERKFGEATQVVQRPCRVGNTGPQLWVLSVLERRADSVDVLFMGLKHRDCLNVNGESTANGAYIVRWPCHVPQVHDNAIFRLHAEAVGG